MNQSRLYKTDDGSTMKTTLLQFDSLADLATFWKGVNNRGYVMVIKDLTLHCDLTDEEVERAVQQNGARQLPQRRAAA